MQTAADELTQALPQAAFSTLRNTLASAPDAALLHPVLRGQRCIIPALSFDEPNWETGRNIWWRFRRADGEPWGLAGLWNAWTDRATGEIHESYTMLTINADDHPLMRQPPPDAFDAGPASPNPRRG